MPEITDPNALSELNDGGFSPAAPKPATKGQIRTIYTAPESPDAAADRARKAAADRRAEAAADRASREENKPPSGFSWGADGKTLVAIPGGPADKPKGKALRQADGDKIEAEVGQYAALKNAMQSFNDDYGGNTFTGGLENTIQAGFSGFGTPGQRDWWASFRATDNVIRNSLYGASLTVGEKQAYDQTTIQPGMDPKIIKQNLARRAELIRTVLARKVARFRAAGYNQDEIDAVLGEYGSDLSAPKPIEPAAVSEKKDKAGFTMGGGWQATPEQDAAFAAYVKTNPSEADLVDFFGKLSGGKSQITPEEASRFLDVQRKNPNAPVGINPAIQDENTLADKAGALAVGGVDAFTGGYLPEVAGLVAGDDAQAKMEENLGAVQNENPGSFFTGEVAGSIGGAAAIGKGAAKLTAKALPNAAPAILEGGGRVAVAREVGKDAAQGAFQGSGQAEEGERLSGAAKGAAWATGGDLAGRGLAKGFGRTLKPKTDPDIALLREKGVRTSIGQSIGPTASKIEEKITSIPIVGDVVRKSRERALADFNQAVVNESLSRIGAKLPKDATGSAAMGHAQRAFNRAYDQARAGMRMVPDAQLQTDLNVLATNARDELDDDTYKAVLKIYDAQIGRRIKKGALDGSQYKDMTSALGRLADTAKREQKFAKAETLQTMQSIVDNAARRSSPVEAVTKLDAADEGYALFVRAENAAKMRGGETGSFTPSQYDSAVQRGDSSVRSKAYLRGDALGQDMAEAGKRILRDNVGTSGTFERAAVGGAMFGGAGLWNPATLAPAAAVMAAYSPKVRDATSSLIAGKRPADVQKWGDWINERSRLAGAGASALALNYGAGSN